MTSSRRVILLTLGMGYFGFLCAGLGSLALMPLTVSGALLGAVGGVLLAVMFEPRAKRRLLTVGVSGSPALYSRR